MSETNKELKRFLENGYRDRRDRILHLINPALVRARHVHLFEQVKRETQQQLHFDTTSATVPPYEGSNPVALAIASLFAKHTQASLMAALVHGSIATNEEVNYSDFDGILIIDPMRIDSRREAKELLNLIRKSEELMYRQDSLQHHGWNILLKSDLSRYPDDQLPFVLIRHSRCLYPLREVKIAVRIYPEQMNYSNGLEQVLRSVEKKTRSAAFAGNLYSTKQYFSEILLLPALYLQARYNEPVWKKDSFIRISAELEQQHLELIEEISDLRKNWPQQRPYDWKNRWGRRLQKAGLGAHFGDNLPSAFNYWLDEKQKQRILDLCKRLHSR
jgi:hypothetical protein